MLSKCANPQCSTNFLHLSDGKLFRWDTHKKPDSSGFGFDAALKKPAQHIEFFWLCNGCAQTMTLSFKRGVGVVTKPVPLTRGVAT